jgi:hypothetical protein
MQRKLIHGPNKLTGVLSFILHTGMSDLCSPMIVLLNDEADAFWCFEKLMRRLVCLAFCNFSSKNSETYIGTVAGHLYLVPFMFDIILIALMIEM